MTASEPPAQNSSKVGRAPSVASAQRHRHAAPAQQQQKQQQQGGQGAVSDMQGLESQPTHSAGPIVDLRLAHTYVPGFACLLRGTVLILLLARFSQSVPVMMATATVLQVGCSPRTPALHQTQGGGARVTRSNRCPQRRIVNRDATALRAPHRGPRLTGL